MNEPGSRMRGGGRQHLFAKWFLIAMSLAIVGAVTLYRHARFQPGFLALFPVEGMYDPIVNRPFGLDRTDHTERFTFRNTYAGGHWIGLAVSEPPRIGVRFDHDFTFEITVWDGDRVLLSRSVSLPEYPFWKKHGVGGGVVLVTYEVPRDLPRARELTCEVKVIKADPGFSREYGSPRLVIAKEADL